MRRKIWLYIVIAFGVVAFALAVAGILANNAASATFETPLYAPVNFYVSSPTVSAKTGFYVDFDIYVQSTTAQRQTNAVALKFTNCNSVPLQLHARTRHLSGG